MLRVLVVSSTDCSRKRFATLLGRRSRHRRRRRRKPAAASAIADELRRTSSCSIATRHGSLDYAKELAEQQPAPKVVAFGGCIVADISRDAGGSERHDLVVGLGDAERHDLGRRLLLGEFLGVVETAVACASNRTMSGRSSSAMADACGGLAAPTTSIAANASPAAWRTLPGTVDGTDHEDAQHAIAALLRRAHGSLA